jgi:energy-coupling factor transport system ATP-binding protein
MNGIVPQFYGGRFFGRVLVMGLDTLEHPVSELAQHIGMVFEDPETQLIATSVENEVAFALENLAIPLDTMRFRIQWALEAVSLAGMEHKPPHALSGGQKQRLAIAVALALQPDLLVLDEPTSQLDPVGTHEVFEVVQTLNRELGVTVLMMSQAAEEMAAYADRIVLLSEGRIVTTGTPGELYAQVALLAQYHVRPPQVATTFYRLKQDLNSSESDARPPCMQVPKIPVTLQTGIAMLKSLWERGAFFVNEEVLKHLDDDASLVMSESRKSAPLIATERLAYVYGDGTTALEDVTLDIAEGEYVAVVGQNGAGKSTLVRHFLKLLDPTFGTVRVAGKDTRGLTTSALARQIGYVAQNPDTQIFSATVADEVAFALRNLGYSAHEVERRVHDSLTAMGLSAYRAHHPFALPRGDRARVVIAAILAMDPEIIIFDEPTTGQDYRGARYILDVSRELHKRGRTILVITHHLYLMPGYAERVIVMGQGKVLLDAPLRMAYHDVETLRATDLVPPQVVLLAQAMEAWDQRTYPLLTPEEITLVLANRV